MASFQEKIIEPRSPSMSKAEDNLSNSEGPLLNRPLGRTNFGISAENISCAASTRSPSRERNVPFEIQSSPLQHQDKKRYCFWVVTLVLAVIGICNMILSITIIHVLRVSRGMEAFEVIPEESLVKFYGRTDLDNILLEGGIIEGYGDSPMELIGDGAGVEINVKNPRHNYPRAKLQVLPDEITFSRVESFEVKDADGNFVFSTNFPNFELPSGVKNINVKIAQTHRIVSPLNESLRLESNRKVELHGAENLKMEAKEIVWMADNNIKLKSNESIIVDGKKGIRIDPKKIPFSTGFGSGQVGQYKICVCMPQGKLYTIHVPTGSTRADCRTAFTLKYNPCL